MTTNTVWVVCRDWGYEGYALPVAAFAKEDNAKAYAEKLSEASSGSFDAYPVPCMWFVPAYLALPEEPKS